MDARSPHSLATMEGTARIHDEFVLASEIEYYATATATATGFVDVSETKVLDAIAIELNAGECRGEVVERK